MRAAKKRARQLMKARFNKEWFERSFNLALKSLIGNGVYVKTDKYRLIDDCVGYSIKRINGYVIAYRFTGVIPINDLTYAGVIDFVRSEAARFCKKHESMISYLVACTEGK